VIDSDALVGIFDEWSEMWASIVEAQDAFTPEFRERIERSPNDPDIAVGLLRAAALSMHPDLAKRHRDMMTEAGELVRRFVDGRETMCLEGRVAELEQENDRLRKLLAGVEALAGLRGDVHPVDSHDGFLAGGVEAKVVGDRFLDGDHRSGPNRDESAVSAD
jgi:hypothetical protein